MLKKIIAIMKSKFCFLKSTICPECERLRAELAEEEQCRQLQKAEIDTLVLGDLQLWRFVEKRRTPLVLREPSELEVVVRSPPIKVRRVKVRIGARTKGTPNPILPQNGG